MTDDFYSLRATLVERRMALGWSQRTVASRAGFGQPYLCELENGKILNPSFDAIARWVAALNGTLPLTPQFDEQVRL